MCLLRSCPICPSTVCDGECIQSPTLALATFFYSTTSMQIRPFHSSFTRRPVLRAQPLTRKPHQFPLQLLLQSKKCGWHSARSGGRWRLKDRDTQHFDCSRSYLARRQWIFLCSLIRRSFGPCYFPSHSSPPSATGQPRVERRIRFVILPFAIEAIWPIRSAEIYEYEQVLSGPHGQEKKTVKKVRKMAKVCGCQSIPSRAGKNCWQ